MEKSFGREAVLEESWTTPWLDDSVFPYWPEAAIIGDLKEFLRWLAVQDEQRTTLVLRHAREFEKVHRLITSELTRIKHGTINPDPSEGLAASEGPPLPASAGDQTSGKQHVRSDSEIEVCGRRSECEDDSLNMRPCRGATEPRLSIRDGHDVLSTTTVSNWANSWPPSPSTIHARGGRLSGQSGSGVATPVALKFSQKAFAPGTARPDRSPAATASSSRRPSTLVTPQPKRAPRRWSSTDLSGAGMVKSGNGFRGVDIYDHGPPEMAHGHTHVSRIGRKRAQVTWATDTSAAAAAVKEEGRNADRVSSLRSSPTAGGLEEVVHYTKVGKQIALGDGYSERHSSTWKPGASLRSLPPPTTRWSVVTTLDTSIHSPADRNELLRKQEQKKSSLNGGGKINGEGGIASLRQQAFENAVNSSGSDRNHDADDRRTTAGKEIKILHDEAKESGDEWLCMRDPISLREFWFDPKTRAAEWEGGEAIEGKPGGVGLGLLSEEERERLKRKIDRRRRRGRHASTPTGGEHGRGRGGTRSRSETSGVAEFDPKGVKRA